MPAGTAYAGQAAAASSRRSIIIRLSGEGDALIAPDASQVIVDDFCHDGDFWRAVVPLDGVERVCGQIFNFSDPKTREGENGSEIIFDKYGRPLRKIPILNHVQSRFTLKTNKPVELYPPGTEQFDTPTHQIHDIIYSPEAVGPAGVMFNLKDGRTGNLLCAHRFMSIEQMVFERIAVENQYVSESPPLPLKESDMRELLIESLQRSHRAGMTDRYYLFRLCGTNNCTSNPLQILDKVVNYSFLGRIGALFYRLPLNPRFYLRIRGLDSDPSFRKLLRNEFEEFIARKETQQRKRDYVRQQIRIRRAAKEVV